MGYDGEFELTNKRQMRLDWCLKKLKAQYYFYGTYHRGKRNPKCEMFKMFQEIEKFYQPEKTIDSFNSYREFSDFLSADDDVNDLFIKYQEEQIELQGGYSKRDF